MQDTVGSIGIQLSWLQIFAGISTPIIESVEETKYIPRGWMKNLHQLLVQYKIQVKLHDTWIPQTQRTNDQIIIQYIRDNIPEWAWEGINTCRLFLKVTTIADLSTIDS